MIPVTLVVSVVVLSDDLGSRSVPRGGATRCTADRASRGRSPAELCTLRGRDGGRVHASLATVKDDGPADARSAGGGPLPPGLGRQLLAAVHPALAGQLGSFRRAAAQLPPTAAGRKVAVIGRSPRCGTTTVAAMLALAAQGYTRNRVVLLDTNTGSGTDAGDHDRRAAALLGRAGGAGRSGQGRLPALLAVPDGEPVSRSRVRVAATPGTVVPVLALPSDAGSFPPQTLAAALDRLRMRADLIVLDTPTAADRPVFHAALHLVDHVLLVIPADRFAPQRLAAGRDWLAAVPGPQRTHDVSVVLVAQTTFVPRWRPEDLPWTLLRRDGALARGQVGRMSRRSTMAALELVGRVSGPLGPVGRRESVR